MMNTPRPQPQPDGQKSIARLLLGRAFSFRISDMIKPLFDSTRAFVHLIAYTFATYKLLPKDYPGLQDPNANMSLFKVVMTSWKNVRHTREGAIQALLFYTVVSIMVVTILFIVSGLLSMFIGTAHAQPIVGCSSPTSETGTFASESCDAARMWLAFLFERQPLSLFEDLSGTTPSWGLQDAIQEALGFYSDAILIIAALILFYHLTSMVLQTAHKGVAMGDQAKQIWAPIRLVMAIGLLVPIAGNLNSGQYIVIKTAELGSGLASQTWDMFLNSMLTTSPTRLPRATSPMVEEIGNKMVEMYACAIDWNARIRKKAQTIPTLNSTLIQFDPLTKLPTAQTTVSMGGNIGTKYSFNMGSTLSGQDACGFIFVPDHPEGADSLTEQVYLAQATALRNNASQFYIAGYQILQFVSPKDAVGGTYDVGGSVPIGPKVVEVVARYQVDVNNALGAVYDGASLTNVATDNVILSMQQYGWAFAGAFMSTVERLQGMVSSIFNAGLPSAEEPNILNSTPLNTADGLAAALTGGLGTFGTRADVIKDYQNFKNAMQISWTSGATTTPTQDTLDKIQCASMIGSTGTAAPTGWQASLMAPLNSLTDSAIDTVFWVIDNIATWNGVWKSGQGALCGAGTPGVGRPTFKLSVSFQDGAEVIQEIVRFGHANIETGLRLMAWGVGGAVIGGLVGMYASPVIGALVAIAILSLFELMAMLFLSLGTVFAFLLPLIPFIRFFFAVLVWVGEVIESVIAIPVVALAHLNPEGEGFLSQQAKRAYGFIFSIFLRPVMTVFGLIAGLMLFIIAANFMNYAYGIAVAATGAMAYNHEILTRIVFTIVYVFTMFMCANVCFQLISEFPNGAVAWMALDKSRTVNIEAPIGDLQKAEALGAGFLIKDGMGAVTSGAKGAAGKIGGIKPDGAPSTGGNLQPGNNP